MAQQREWQLPVALNFPTREGRKPPTIPDTTQFSTITHFLFGVSCVTPGEAYRYGTHNELYLLQLNVPPKLQSSVPSKVLARVSRDDKARSDISLESEIATLVFVKMKTSIPVPTVYGYCPSRNNAVGQPFSILSFTEGEDMNGAPWEELNLDAKLAAIRDYARVILELSRLHFDRIGSIYLIPGASPPNCFKLGPVSWCKHESATRKQRCNYDRGPWRNSVDWIRAALADEIEFMERAPDVAETAYGHRRDGGERWRLAQKVLPELQDRISDVVEDSLDRCAAGPFVLGHMDLNPWNIVFAPSGPNAGRILSILDWEMSMTVPLWDLVCYPAWFGRVGKHRRRDPKETQLFKDTYIRELQKHSRDSSILSIVQSTRYETKRRFADVAIQPWPAADQMSSWLQQNIRRS